jgi:chondroitin synthase
VSKGWNWPMFSREYLLTKMIVHHFRFFRKRDFMRTNGFDETIKNAVDYDMMLKLAEVGEVKHLNKVLYQYRRHSEMTTVIHNNEQSKNNFLCINNSLNRQGIKNISVTQSKDNSIERTVEFKKFA